MPSKYFTQHYYTAVESTLIEDLFEEAIYIQGFTAYYIPKDNVDYDKLFGDAPIKNYKNAFPLDAYLVNSEYGDTNDFFSKFGLEIRNSVKLQFGSREFSRKLPNFYARPKEGDLIYIPFLRNKGEVFEIKFVNTTKDLNVLARMSPFYYELDLELFKYNNEDFNTGIAAIDEIELNNSFSTKLVFNTGSGTYVVDETVYQGNTSSHLASAQVSSWDSANNTLHVINVIGEFSLTANVAVTGNTSLASYHLLSENNRHENTQFDNATIHDEASLYITTEDNPFGGLANF